MVLLIIPMRNMSCSWNQDGGISVVFSFQCESNATVHGSHCPALHKCRGKQAGKVKPGVT